MSNDVIDGIVILKLIEIVIENKILLNSMNYSYCTLTVFEIIRILITKIYKTDISEKIIFILSSISLLLTEYFLFSFLIENISNKYDLI